MVLVFFMSFVLMPVGVLNSRREHIMFAYVSGNKRLQPTGLRFGTKLVRPQLNPCPYIDLSGSVVWESSDRERNAQGIKIKYDKMNH